METFDEHSPRASEQLKQVFDYCPTSGSLLWKARPPTNRASNTWNTRYAGKRAGCNSTKRCGYKQGVVIQMKKAANPGLKWAHRLIWIFHNGPIPEGMQIDHKDGNTFNNQIENLRVATPSQNSTNNAGRRNRIIDLPHGVYFRHGKYQSGVVKEGKYYHCGTFLTAEEAHAARLIKAKEIHGEFSRYQA